MDKPCVGLITFGDERDDMWRKVFQNLTEPRHALLRNHLADLPVELFASDEVARTRDQINAQVDSLRANAVDVLVAHTPCWTSPNLVLHGVQRLRMPVVLVTSKSAATHGMVGFFGAGGAMAQVGISHLRIREDYGTAALTKKIMPFLRAAYAVNTLHGEVFGFFGGRSLGIDTGSFDPMQWRQQFGIDVEHVDQLEIIRRADAIYVDDRGRADRMVAWLEENTKSINYNELVLTRDKLAYQASCYLATRDIIEEKKLGFVAIKCMPDLSTNYVPQCLSAALLPGPFDVDGVKAIVSMACEADGDGALTMEILKHVSGGLPVMFGDLSHIDEEESTLYLPNCGAMSTWYAGRSDDPRENLKKVELRPSVRPGGASTVYFTAAPGPVTLARLYRWSGEYRMAIIPGEAITLAQGKLAAFVEARGPHQLPTAFVKVTADIDELIGEFGSNHISGVAGDVVEELLHFCEMKGITPVVLE
jgi:L-fucose/D-arabinose isomerase